MAKQYIVRFGSGSPASFSGLSPTLSLFCSVPGGSTLVGPTITEIPAATGLYTFAYAPTLPIAFVVDGGGSLSSTDRFVVGVLDPIQAVDDKVGFSFDSIGSTAVDPTTLLGYVKRALEFWEGDGSFNKTTGAWEIYSRGSSTLLRSKVLSNSSGDITKS